MNRVVFLDRDGTINVDKNYVHSVEQFEYEKGAVEGMRLLNDAGLKIIIVTNQSGIARGYFTEEEYVDFNNWIVDDLRNRNVEILDSYYCPHLPDADIVKYRVLCNCRKPATGLYWRAQKEHDIDMDNSFAVGDNLRDLYICNESNVKGYWITGDSQSEVSCGKGVHKCTSLYDAALQIRYMLEVHY